MPQNQNNDNIELTDEQVLSMAKETLTQHFNLLVDGYKFTTEDIWNVVVSASVQRQAIESTTKQFKNAPDSTTVRFYLRNELLKENTLKDLEVGCNQAMVANLPPYIVGKSHKVAIDLTYIPYHGEAEKEEKEICRSKAKSGTTHFHCYASAYVIKKNKRVSLAITYVQSDDTLTDVLERIFTYLRKLDVEIKTVYLDKQFYCVPVIGYFQTQYPSLKAIIPVIIQGKQGGSRALIKGKKSYRTVYTMRSSKYGEASFDVAVVRKYSKGRYNSHGVVWFAYVLLGNIQMPLHQIYQDYRLRFGIESTYRLMNQVRARTSSRSPSLRLLYVGIALSLVNIWVFLKWTYLGIPRRGGRDVHEQLFPLNLFKHFLIEAIKRIYVSVKSVSITPILTEEA